MSVAVLPSDCSNLRLSDPDPEHACAGRGGEERVVGGAPSASDPTPHMPSAAGFCPFSCPQHIATFTWNPRSTGHWPVLSVSVWPPHVGAASNNVTLAPLLQPASNYPPCQPLLRVLPKI